MSAAASASSAATPADLGDGFAEAKRLLLAHPKSCFLNEAALCLDDDAIIAEALARAMKQKFVQRRVGETLPTGGEDLEFVVERARASYKLAQTATSERREKIEKLLGKRYRKPKVRREKRMVIADHGYLPGPIEPYRNRWTLQKSPLVKNGSWDTAEIGRAFEKLAQAHPQAEVLRLEVRAPQYSSFKTLKVTYRKVLDRVRIDGAGSAHFWHLSKQLGGDFGKLVREEITLVPKDMHSCSRKADDGIGGPCTPPLD